LLSVTGSEGVLFAAVDAHAPAPRRHIALKIARPGLSRHELDRVWRRWSQAAAARIHHDGLVRIDEPFLGPVPGSENPSGPALLYLPMELVHGTPLDQLIADAGTYGIGALAALRLPAAALDYLATKGLTHLDFKPGNVIVRPDGSGVIVDLGTLRASDAAPTIFTLGFVAPEILAADKPTEQSLSRADAYSFAATVSWALTGAQPLRLPDDAEWTARLLRLLPDSPALRATLLPGLSCDPARRPSSLLRWLDEVAAAAIHPAPPDRSLRRGRAARSLAAAAVVCATAGVATWRLMPPAHPSATAALASTGSGASGAVGADVSTSPLSPPAPRHKHRHQGASGTGRKAAATPPSARVLTISAPRDLPQTTPKPYRSPSPPTSANSPDPQPSPTAPSAATVDLPATNASMPTGLRARSGEAIEISATGTASYGYQGATADNDLTGMSGVDPDGNLVLDGAPRPRKYDALALLPAAPVGALIARVGAGPWFLVGSTWSGNTPTGGALWLAFNDVPGSYGDNSGTYLVTARIQPSS
jgi:serine/threonine protein kinase